MATRGLGEIFLTFNGSQEECDTWTQNILGDQDPMGLLEKPVSVRIGGFVAKGFATSYVCGGVSREHQGVKITIRTAE